MTERPENDSSKDSRYPPDDAHFAIVVLAVTSCTLIIFVLIVTLLMT